jgi:hypothetical protein
MGSPASSSAAGARYTRPRPPDTSSTAAHGRRSSPSTNKAPPSSSTSILRAEIHIGDRPPDRHCSRRLGLTHRTSDTLARARRRRPPRDAAAHHPGIGDLLGLTIASEIGDVSRFSSPRKLVGYAGLAPRISQSGDRSRMGALSKAGSRTPRWAAVEAAHQSSRPTNPLARALRRHHQPRRQEPGQVRRRAQDPDRRLARPLTRAALQGTAPAQPDSTTVSASSAAFWPPDGPAGASLATCLGTSRAGPRLMRAP